MTSCFCDGGGGGGAALGALETHLDFQWAPMKDHQKAASLAKN